jgi:hypothetical protein
MASKLLTFVPDWKQSWRWASMRLHFVATLVMGFFLMTPHMPQEVQDLLPYWARPIAVAAWFFIGAYVRLVQQGSPPCPSED